jgi:hypothetical protein
MAECALRAQFHDSAAAERQTLCRRARESRILISAQAWTNLPTFSRSARLM